MSLPTVLLGDARIRTTSLGFGCAGLFRVSDPSQRLHLLRTAYDMGIRHFDVAPMYGLGRAERELGNFIKARRDELTIASKFGIKPTIIGQCLGYAQRPIRRIFATRPSIHEQARAAAGPTCLASEPSRVLYELGGYDAAGARRSLERSLRALSTDHVDLFLLHEPIPGSVRTDELSSYLEEARRAGLIRTWGIAGEPKPTSEVAKSFHGYVPVRQLRDDIFIRSLNCLPNGTVPITYGVISRAVASITNYVNASEDTSNRWQELTGTNCGKRDNVASFLLRAALRTNGAGVVLFSTTSPSHIRNAVSDLRMFHRSEDPALDSFTALVDAELRESHNVKGKGS